MGTHRAAAPGHDRASFAARWHVPHLEHGSLLRALFLAFLATMLLPAVIGGPGGAVAQEQERAVEWARFDVTLDLRQDGSFHIQERQEVDFRSGPFSGGFRDVPLARIEDVNNIEVSEEAGGVRTPYTYETAVRFDEEPNTYTWRKTSTQLRIEWGFAPTRNQVRTFFVEYDVAGGMRSYLDLDRRVQEIWWTPVGSELTEVAPVRESTMTVRLPLPIPVRFTSTDPRDAAGWGGETVLSRIDIEATPTAADAAEFNREQQVWTWSASDSSAGDSFETFLQFPAFVRAGPPAWQAADDKRRRNEFAREERGAFLNVVFIGVGLLVAVGGGLGTYGLWYSRGRDPHTGLVADFLTAPPDDLPPGAAGTLLDERADEQDIVATMVDLGHRGLIKIDESETTGVFGLGGSRDFNLTLLADTPVVAPFEEELLQAFFGRGLKEGATARLSEVKGRFTSLMPAIRDDLYAEVVRRGYFARSPEATRDAWRTGGRIAVVVAIVAGVVGVGAFADVAGFIWFPVIVLVGLALLVVVMSGSLPRKTEAGAEAAARWRAFRKYLDDIEKYEKLDEAQAIFDRYLPYAIAFGLERSWVEKFAGVQTPTPAWYGGGGFAGGGGYGGAGWGDVGPDLSPRRRRGRRGSTVIMPGGGWGSGGQGGGGGDFD